MSVENEKLNGEEAELNGVESADESAVEAEVASSEDEAVDQKDWKAEAEALAQQIDALKYAHHPANVLINNYHLQQPKQRLSYLIYL